MNAQWAAIQENLRKTLEPGVFKVWIAPLTGEIRDAELQVTAPSEYAANWIRGRLASDIREAAVEAGEDVRVTVSAAKQDPARKEASAGEVPAPLPGGRCARPRFSFEDFVVGPSNEMAYAATRSLCAGLAEAGILFISSDAGLGKTHLVQAMGGCLSGEGSSVRCLTAEEFASGFVAALRAREAEAFKERLRRSKVLLLEDVQFLQHKAKMQEETLALIKSLRAGGSRVALTASVAPQCLQGMDSRLVSLFCSGLLTHMTGPDFETRLRIVREKARVHQVVLPDCVSEFLAERLSGDIRLLESCLNTLVFKARLLNCRIGMELAGEVARQYARPGDNLDMENIIRLVCAGFRLSGEQLASRSRRREYVQARNVVFYLARKHTHFSLEEIGERLHRTHSGVIRGLTAVEREMRSQTPLGRQFAHAVSLVEKNAGILLAP